MLSTHRSSHVHTDPCRQTAQHSLNITTFTRLPELQTLEPRQIGLQYSILSLLLYTYTCTHVLLLCYMKTIPWSSLYTNCDIWFTSIYMTTVRQYYYTHWSGTCRYIRVSIHIDQGWQKWSGGPHDCQTNICAYMYIINVHILWPHPYVAHMLPYVYHSIKVGHAWPITYVAAAPALLMVTVTCPLLHSRLQVSCFRWLHVLYLLHVPGSLYIVSPKLLIIHSTYMYILPGHKWAITHSTSVTLHPA